MYTLSSLDRGEEDVVSLAMNLYEDCDQSSLIQIKKKEGNVISPLYSY
jgi:hypothetical protein